jgi:hypothetical protein
MECLIAREIKKLKNMFLVNHSVSGKEAEAKGSGKISQCSWALFFCLVCAPFPLRSAPDQHKQKFFGSHVWWGGQFFLKNNCKRFKALFFLN